MSKQSGLGMTVQPAGGPFIRHTQAGRTYLYEAVRCSYCQTCSGPATESCRVCGAPRDPR